MAPVFVLPSAVYTLLKDQAVFTMYSQTSTVTEAQHACVLVYAPEDERFARSACCLMERWYNVYRMVYMCSSNHKVLCTTEHTTVLYRKFNSKVSEVKQLVSHKHTHPLPTDDYQYPDILCAYKTSWINRFICWESLHCLRQSSFSSKAINGC